MNDRIRRGARPDSCRARMPAALLVAAALTFWAPLCAARAAAFTLAVTYPEAGNLGGGGFMLAWIDGAAVFLDYREVAPAAASRDMYLDAQGELVGDPSLTGARAGGAGDSPRR